MTATDPIARKARFSRAFRELELIVRERVGWPLLLLLAAGGLAFVAPPLALAFLPWWWAQCALRVERVHLDYFLLPPLVLYAFQHVVACGAGLPLLWWTIGPGGNGTAAEAHAVFQVQIAHTIGFGALLSGYVLARGRVPAFRPPTSQGQDAGSIRLLIIAGWLLLAYYLIVFASGLLTGASDRARLQEFLGRFGIWSWFRLLPRLEWMAFLLIPLLLRHSAGVVRHGLTALVGGLLAWQFFSGSRSQLLIPAGLLLVGWWMFGRAHRTPARLVMVLPFLVIPYVAVVPLVRSHEAFTNTAGRGVGSRFSAFAGAGDIVRGQQFRSVAQLVGESLFGANDREVFLRTPSELPHAGWADVGRLKYFWLPSLLAPEKKPLLDGVEIVRTYRNDPQIFGATLTFTGDMYRRFGWLGILVGNLTLGAALGRFWGAVFRARYGNRFTPAFATLLALYGVTYFSSVPFQTLLETCWIWFWEFPKHLVALAALILLSRVMLANFRSRPATLGR